MRGLLALGLGVLLATGVATGGDAKTDSAKLQGKWTGEFKDTTFELTFAKATFTLTIVGKETYKGTFKIDPKKKPKELDLTFTEGNELKGKTSNGIYEVTGDTLKWCANEPGKMDRAKDFKEMGPNYLNITLKRVK